MLTKILNIAQTTNKTILKKGSLAKIFHIAGSEFLKNTIEIKISLAKKHFQKNRL